MEDKHKYELMKVCLDIAKDTAIRKSHFKPMDVKSIEEDAKSMYLSMIEVVKLTNHK